jgi:hypothetical protein
LRHRKNVTRPATRRSWTLTTGPLLDQQRRSATPPTARRVGGQLDLDLEPTADLDHPRHDHPFDPDQAANVILHPLFLLLRVFDNATPPEGSGCLLLSPSTRPFSKTPTFDRP